jgi:iron complex outermembrane recepter protein
MHKVTFVALLGLLGMLSVARSMPVLADSADQATTAQASPSDKLAAGESANGLSEIIVTARRMEERLQDVPISITVFNQQQLSSRNIINSQDLAAYTPSLSANNNFGSQNASFAIRGFVQDIGTQPSVGVYFADVVSPRGASPNIPIGDGAGPGTFFDLQNVQVLKGPQGTLFGRNTTGGAILIVPQKPTSTLEGYVEGSVGNYNMKRIQGVINVPLNDNLRFRMGVDHQQRNGYELNDSGFGPPRLNDVDYTAVRASLVADITPDVENYTILSYLLSDNNGEVQKVIGCNPSTSPTNFLGQLACAQLQQEQAKGAGFFTVQSDLTNPDTRLQQWQAINTTTWRTSDNLTIKNIISYAQLAETLRTAQFGTNFRIIFPPFFPPPGVPINFANSTPIPGGKTADESTATEEIQLQGRSLNDRLIWQGGAYFEAVDPLATVGSQSPVLLDCTNSDTFDCLNPIGAGSVNYTTSKTRYRNVGLYAQDTYSLTDFLKLTGGVRYTWDWASSYAVGKTFEIPTPGTGVPFCTNPDRTLPNCDLRVYERSSAPTWLVDLDYIPVQDVLLYGKYTRGYRAGGTIPGAPPEFSTYKPEKVDTFETGFKTTFHAPVSGTFNVALFYNNFRDQQLQINLDPKPGRPVSPATGILNAGKSRIYGAEVESSINPFDPLTLQVSYTYLNTELQKVTLVQTSAASPYQADAPIRPGDPLVLSPKNKVSVSATYRLPLPQSLGKLSAGAVFTHTDSTIANYIDRNSGIPAIVRLGTLPSLDLLNLNIDWNSVGGSRVDVGVFVTNVADKQYYTFVPGLYGTIGAETANLGLPRFFGGRVRYTF